VAGMKQVVTAVGKHHGLAFLFPAFPLFDEFLAAVKTPHQIPDNKCSSLV